MKKLTNIPYQVFKCPQPDGVLRITVVEAKNLMHCDFGFFGSGQSDPYVVLSIGAKKYRTETIKKTGEIQNIEELESLGGCRHPTPPPEFAWPNGRFA